jgi:ribonuclease HI
LRSNKWKKAIFADMAAGRVIIFTDGACRGNPGPGGWAAVLMYEGARKIISGSTRSTTNNRMELTAAIEALNVLKCRCAVQLFTDSQYLQKGIQNWLPRWKRRGFRTIDGQAVKNQDLWQKLEQANGRHDVAWMWVRGHADNVMNDLCDRLAKEALEHGLREGNFNASE